LDQSKRRRWLEIVKILEDGRMELEKDEKQPKDIGYIKKM
jgi:hypothetical protein